ncbi:hypothetical protein TOT_010000527 [Theileria orientalis strain Shintoku]|uniref:Uncharacterized protein n=1 Tax=Theileria orientalis strain Shintoku TaxID=869250 RepID=J4DNJ4_THEOR|nr:hypothetical protein TOT_010000527 [Theileria orientalis strain Shintoku]BAM39064.1 hypothetical protein TOT_010000527 [Theileria orientalis strain Shintoku]|eukprot:XP_009689365.1 hypothetical protein TOT_010000527 [Theileria orientalis strain Shintoku]
MKFLGFYGVFTGVLVAVLRAHRVLGDSPIEEFGKKGGGEFKFNVIREVNMFFNEIMYFLDQAEWVSEEDIEYMLKLLDHYKQRLFQELSDKALELEINKDTLELNEYRKLVNEFRISESEENEIGKKNKKTKNDKTNDTIEKSDGIQKLKEKDGMGKHEIKSEDEVAIEEKDGNIVDKSELRGSSSKKEEKDERKIERDIRGRKLKETEGNGNGERQAKVEELKGRKRNGALSPIDEKFNESDTEDEEQQEQYGKLDVLPAREVNRIRDKMDSISEEMGTLEEKLKELVRIQGVVNSLKDQLEEHLRLQQASALSGQFPELGGDQASVSAK